MHFPNKERSFYFDYTSQFGNRYEGNFTVKCLLSIGEKHRLELEKTRLLGNHINPTDELIGIAVILSNLRAKILEAPNWWTQSRGGESIEEEDVLANLYGQVQDAEMEWRKELAEKAKKAEESTPKSESKEPQAQSTDQ